MVIGRFSFAPWHGADIVSKTMTLHQLEYSKRPARRIPRWLRIAGLSLLGTLIVISAEENLPEVMSRYDSWMFQHKMMHLDRPADRVIYEEDPVRSAMLANDPNYKPIVPFSRDFDAAAPTTQPLGIAYVDPIAQTRIIRPWGVRCLVLSHLLRMPSGAERLVVVYCVPNKIGWKDVREYFFLRVFDPGLPLQGMRMTARIGGIDRPPPDAETHSPLRVYAGQVDPADPTHFSVRFQRGQESGVIDGYLKDDESVSLKVRGQSATSPTG